MAACLEERARCPDQQAANAALRRVLDPKLGQEWLEVGCGSGVLCRQLTPTLGPSGRISGLGLSYEMLQAARRIDLEAGPTEAVSWAAGDAERLPFVAGAFDGVFAARLLLHAAHPQAVVNEMARVVKPSG